MAFKSKEGMKWEWRYPTCFLHMILSFFVMLVKIMLNFYAEFSCGLRHVLGLRLI